MSNQQDEASLHGSPGSDAETPQDIPRQGWLQILKRAWAQTTEDQVPLLGAGVAFFGFLALFPSLIALVLAYGLFADPGTIATQIDSLGSALPAEVKTLIIDQLTAQAKPATIDRIIGLATMPRPIGTTVARRSPPLRPAWMIRVISVENTSISMVRTISTGPTACSPKSTTSIGTPRKPVLPIMQHCASIAESDKGRPRARAAAMPTSQTARDPAR